MIPTEAAISGPVPNAAMRPMAPGSAATHCATAIIQSMPNSMIRQNTPSKPNGIATRPSIPAGITSSRHHRHRREIGEHAVGRDAMEVERRVGRRRETRDKGRQRQHRDFAPAP